MGDLRKKNIPQTDFDKKNNLARKQLRKKYPALKISRMADNAGKKSYTVECWGKNSFSRVLGKKNPYPNQITHTPHQKSKGRPLIPYFGLQWK